MNKKQQLMKIFMIISIMCLSIILIMYILIIIMSVTDFHSETRFLHNKIESYVKKNCENKDTCYLFLKDITDFEWDKFYIVPVGKKNINKILGFEYPFDSRGDAETYVFLKDGKIVYHYEELYKVSRHFEVIPEKYTFCESVDSCQIKDYLLFSPKEANFYIETSWSERRKKYYYYLYPIVTQ